MKQILLLLAITSLANFAISQQHQIDYDNVREGEDVEYCRTHKKMNALQKNAAFLKIQAADQAILQKKENELSQKKGLEKAMIYQVPVVFHVLHNGGGENISIDQVSNALFVLNRDFRLQNADTATVASAFQGMPSDVEVEFVLATKAPNGVCFGGITRTQSPLSFDGSSGSSQVTAIVNGNDVYNGQWPGNKYLNVFVCADIGGAAGYTYTPNGWIGSAMSNGIWILHNYVGSIGTSNVTTSRTMTHEVGHWLNLSHTWGPNNNPGNATSCNDDDAVSDTPNTIGVTSCSLSESTCGVLANVENYMDYSYCSKMFTAGQATRMRAALTSSIGGRNNLWTVSNLIATGIDGSAVACVSEFSTPRKTICAGETIGFSDESYNNISEWSWTFTGGTPAVSITQNPSITYNTPGTYAVNLQVTDGVTTLSENKLSYITVLPSTGNNLPFSEGFENATSIPNANWGVENIDNFTTFQITSAAASLGSKSVKLNNYSNAEAGDIDELVSKAFDLSNMASVTMTFSYAFAKKNSSNTDKLQVLGSTDCGATWSPRKTISSSQMSTVNGGGTVTNNFVPSAADWKQITVTSIVSVFLTDGFRYKFLFTSGNGNNLYIDDINLYGTDTNGVQIGGPTSIIELIESNAINVYPNPANDDVSISLELTNRHEFLSIGIYDLLGKKILSVFEGDIIEGEHVFNANTEPLTKGIYLVIINNGNNIVSQKLIIND